ncbi:MAG: response regulator [Spirochaetia bacterium]|nr:response regulator [Spirochaetia bacterium]
MTIKRILFVDDEEDIRTVVKVSLEKVGGFTLQICSSGKEALQAAPHFRPDLLLLDVMMPEMDGIATLSALREISELKEIPVIFLTASVQEEQVAKLKEHGALDVIPKPFDPLTLPEVIKSICE